MLIILVEYFDASRVKNDFGPFVPLPGAFIDDCYVSFVICLVVITPKVVWSG